MEDNMLISNFIETIAVSTHQLKILGNEHYSATIIDTLKLNIAKVCWKLILTL